MVIVANSYTGLQWRSTARLKETGHTQLEGENTGKCNGSAKAGKGEVMIP